MKRTIFFFFAAALVIACGGCWQTLPAAVEDDPSRVLLEERIPDDNVRNWYEIFIYSFADSDGDRIGDFRGAAEKLEYIRDLGFTGIWLMPVMPSPSYHKYDVTDYYSVDPAYGTIEDFQAFLEKAHNHGIKVILDLVLNHTSNEHPWFQNAKTGVDAQYRDYYNFQDHPADGYQQLGDDYYECRFVSSMPDLNLDSDAVRAEIVDIMAHWLHMGVDGFRLDAVTSYYTGDSAKNIEFLSWLNTQAKKIDPDCYLVGECWADESTIAAYYASGVDSFFYFPMSAGNGSGEIAKILSEESVDRRDHFGKLVIHLEERFGADKLMAPFLDNHDTDRITNVLGIYNLDRLKAAYGLLSVMRGGTFVYYGGEIGMVGSGVDPNKRIGMYWTSLPEVTACPPGTTEAKYPLGNVADQREDSNSLLNYVRRAMNLRNAYPEIARGTTELLGCDDSSLCMMKRTWEGNAVTIVINLSKDEKRTCVNAGALLGTLDANLETGNGIVFMNGELLLDPWGIAILQ